MKIVAIHQPQYLPYLGFFDKVARSDVLVLLDDTQFQKGGFQNRNRIRSLSAAEEWQWLTVPVLRRFGQEIREVKINRDVAWARKHWNAIRMSYSKSPFFDAHAAALGAIYEQRFDDLLSLDVALIQWALSALDIAVPVLLSSSLPCEGERTARLVSICRQVGANAYLSGPGGRDYMDTDLFSEAGIELIWQDFESLPYAQHPAPKGSFVANLSVVDGVLSCGKGIGELLCRP